MHPYGGTIFNWTGEERARKILNLELGWLEGTINPCHYVSV
jgi:hypothetical protein